MDVPDETGLGHETENDEDEVGEEEWLVVQDCHSLVGGADALEPVKLGHILRTACVRE